MKQALNIDVFYAKRYDLISTILQVLSFIFLAVGILLPIYLISDSHGSTQIIILSLYLGIVLMSFSAIAELISVSLNKPTEKTIWLEETSSVFGLIMSVIGVIGFVYILSNAHGPFDSLNSLGIIGGFIFLLFNGIVGMLCFGAGSIHNKYIIDRRSQFPAADKKSFCPNCGKKLELEPGDQKCYHCGGKL
ncbi:MAG: zinc ribbon domain-containing protein [Lentimicrobium sp.]|jgi:vacuolar-type H+-ATPase subunit I/STV1|nr:zinc ribbon domain-containing protein [Lentimicrobium sp.]